VGPHRGCATGRLERAAKDGLAVAGGLRVMCEHGCIGRSVGSVLERAERAPVQVEPAIRRDRLVDGETRELVPEVDTVLIRDELRRRWTGAGP
jgi:hypothetical protein